MVRISGYADLVGLNYDFHEFRKEYMIKFTKEFFGEKYFDEKKANFWVGLRPVTIDDVAIIGRSTKYDNLFWNTGHGCRGISSSIASALLLSNAMNGSGIPENLVPESYSPKRFNI